MIGKSILHYKIIEKLGEGGMGVVYLAEDSKLERRVAIKFLPHHIASNSAERKRFEQEAKAAAALNHPNIATIHAIEEADDEIFLVMEYISGRHLKEYINSKSLPLEEAIDIAKQIARGLQEAHSHGIVHRDIKSSNIMSDEKGRVKIMDFGLAKVRGAAQLTQMGTTVGTAAYMSPEQARGQEVDERTDIWSLGVIFYEMLTGRMVFPGDYEQAVIFSILNEPAELTETDKHVPAYVKKVIEKCLQKDLKERYQNIDQLLKDLDACDDSLVSKNKRKIPFKNPALIYSTVVFIILLLLIVIFNPFSSSSTKIEAIAVLPLENLSGDADQEYFVDGMTDAIITELSKIKALRIISRTSVMQYKNAKKTLPQIADELNVNALLEGSVIQSEGRVRITVQLIGLEPERHLWTNNFDRDLTDFLVLSGEVASEIASEIKISLSPEEKQRLTVKRTVNAEANKLLLLARYNMKQSTEKEATLKALDNINKALQLDSSFALAYGVKASAYERYYNTGYVSWEDVLPNIWDCVNKALQIDSTQEDALYLKSVLLFRENRDYGQRENHIKEMIERNPSSVDAHWDYEGFLNSMGRYQQALDELKIIRQLDPLSNSIQYRAARTYFNAHMWGKAIEAFRFSLELDPDNINTKWWLARAYAHKGIYDKAIAEFLSRKVKSPETNWALGWTYAKAGQPQKTREILDFLLAKEKRTYVPPYYIARLFIVLGDYDKAFEWFAKDGWIDFILSDPMLDPIRKDPRFFEYVKKYNYPDSIEVKLLGITD